MSDRLFGDRHGPTPNEMRRALDVRAGIPPRTEPSRYDQLGPLARALVDDYDALDLAEMLVKAQDELAALRPVARGYCPHCGRGDAAPTVDDWEQQRQRADRAEAELRHYTEAESADAAAGSYAHRAEHAEAALADVRRLADGWVKAGPPPLGTSMSRWWDARLVELHDAIRPPAHDAGPTVAEAAANDRRWPLERDGE